MGCSRALSWRKREVAEERWRGGDEERRLCLKRAVEINQYVYVLEEQSVPLAEEHSTVRFLLDCFYRTLCVYECVCVFGKASRPVLVLTSTL